MPLGADPCVCVLRKQNHGSTQPALPTTQERLGGIKPGLSKLGLSRVAHPCCIMACMRSKEVGIKWAVVSLRTEVRVKLGLSHTSRIDVPATRASLRPADHLRIAHLARYALYAPRGRGDRLTHDTSVTGPVCAISLPFAEAGLTVGGGHQQLAARRRRNCRPPDSVP